MGYRSDVAYCIRFKSKEHRIAFMKNQVTKSEIKLNEFRLINDETILFYEEQTKWYDEYESVKQHEALLELAKEEGCAWECARVGEEYGDMTYKLDTGLDDEGNEIDTPDVIYPSQSIYVDDAGQEYTED